MSKVFPDETFLARWLNGSLTEQEQQGLQAREDYDALKRTVKMLEGLEMPAYSEEIAWEKLLRAKQQDSQAAIRPMRRWRAYGAAATLAVIVLFTFLIFQAQQSFQTDLAEQEAVQLPDGSVITLNADSKLTFNTLTWPIARKVKFAGEGFFEVAKGKKFNVSTPSGSVQVLGTRFNVWSRQDQFQIVCHEGKVKVNYRSQQAILEEGQTVGNLNQQAWAVQALEVADEPAWTQGQFELDDIPVRVALEELERQYDKQFQYAGDTEKIIDIAFPYQNLDTALYMLKTILNSELSFSADSSSITLTPLE